MNNTWRLVPILTFLLYGIVFVLGYTRLICGVSAFAALLCVALAIACLRLGVRKNAANFLVAWALVFGVNSAGQFWFAEHPRLLVTHTYYWFNIVVAMLLLASNNFLWNWSSKP